MLVAMAAADNMVLSLEVIAIAFLSGVNLTVIRGQRLSSLRLVQVHELEDHPFRIRYE